MTTPDTEALRRVAGAAVKSYRDDAPDKAAAIDFDVTFDPPTVLALLDERDAAANRISELEARVGVLEAKGKTLEAALAVNGYPVSDAHWRNASGDMSIQARALHLAATDFRAALTPQEKDQGR